MKFIKNWLLKRKRLKHFLKVLRPYLKEKHGKSINLDYHAVNEALIYLELNGKHDEYAYAMSLSKEQYQLYKDKNGLIYSQGSLQSELGVDQEILKVNFPGGGY